MKRICLPLLFLLFAAGLFAQKHLTGNAEKNTLQLDPTQIVGLPPDSLPPMLVCQGNQTGNLTQVGLITFLAEDLVQFLSDNETPISFIKIGVRIAGTGIGFPLDENGIPIKTLTLNCTNIGVQTIELWAWTLLGTLLSARF